jgi:hypothetical protein
VAGLFLFFLLMLALPDWEENNGSDMFGSGLLDKESSHDDASLRLPTHPYNQTKPICSAQIIGQGMGEDGRRPPVRHRSMDRPIHQREFRLGVLGSPFKFKNSVKTSLGRCGCCFDGCGWGGPGYIIGGYRCTAGDGSGSGTAVRESRIWMLTVQQ